jgi:excisionase family DNA binding protein
MNNMLSIEEVKNFLEVDHSEIEKYLKAGKLHAYKIGGTYLRFRKEEVLTLRSELLPKKGRSKPKKSFVSAVSDFWSFNNFYIISLIVVIALAVLAVNF